MITTKTELLERIHSMWEAALTEISARRSIDAELESASRLDVYERVSKFLPPEDHLADLASWAFNQAIHKLANVEGAPKNMRVLIGSVTLDLFDEMMKSNLKHISWMKEDHIWSNTPARPHDLN